MRKTNKLGLAAILSLAFSCSAFAAAPAAKTAAEPAAKTATAPATKAVHHKHHAHKHHHHHKHHDGHHHHHHHAHHAHPFHGYYVGGSLGGVITSATQERSYQSIVNTLPIGVDTFWQINSTGPISLKDYNSFKGALYAGYGKCWDDLYLGAELFIDLANYKNHDEVNRNLLEVVPGVPLNVPQNSSVSTHTKLSPFQFGVDVRPGYLFTPESMLYARVGVAFAEQTVRVFDGSNGNINNGLFWDQTISAENEKNVAGLRLGAGLETHICKCWNMRMDYIYTYYGHNSVSGAAIQPLTGGGAGASTFALADSSNVKMYTNSVMLGLTYLI